MFNDELPSDVTYETSETFSDPSFAGSGGYIGCRIDNRTADVVVMLTPSGTIKEIPPGCISRTAGERLVITSQNKTGNDRTTVTRTGYTIPAESRWDVHTTSITLSRLRKGPIFVPECGATFALKTDIDRLRNEQMFTSDFYTNAVQRIADEHFKSEDEPTSVCPFLIFANCHNPSKKYVHIGINGIVMTVRAVCLQNVSEKLIFTINHASGSEVYPINVDWRSSSCLEEDLITKDGETHLVFGTNIDEVRKKVHEYHAKLMDRLSPEMVKTKIEEATAALKKEMEALKKEKEAVERKLKTTEYELNNSEDATRASLKEKELLHKFVENRQAAETKQDENAFKREEAERKAREAELRAAEAERDAARKIAEAERKAEEARINAERDYRARREEEEERRRQEKRNDEANKWSTWAAVAGATVAVVTAAVKFFQWLGKSSKSLLPFT